MNKPKIIAVYGVSGSGKTSLARSMNKEGEFNQLERDEIRQALGYLNNGWGGYDFCPEKEYAVTHAWHVLLQESLYNSQSIIISDTMTNIVDRRCLKFLAGQYDFDMEFIRMDTPLEDCIKRDSLRGGLSVGENVIRRQWKKLNGHKEHY